MEPVTHGRTTVAADTLGEHVAVIVGPGEGLRDPVVLAEGSKDLMQVGCR